MPKPRRNKRPETFSGLARPSSTRRDALFVEHIPETVRNFFKAACYKRGTNMKEQILKFMTVYAESDGKFPTYPENIRHHLVPK